MFRATLHTACTARFGQTATRPSGSDKGFAYPKLRLQAVVLVRSHITAHPLLKETHLPPNIEQLWIIINPSDDKGF